MTADAGRSLPSFLRDLMRDPLYDRDLESRRAHNFRLIGWGLFLISNTAHVWLLATQPALRERTFSVMLSVDVTVLALLELNRRGWPRLASVLLVTALIARNTANAIPAGGVHATAMLGFPVWVLMAGLLVGRWGAAVATVTCTGIALALAQAELHGHLPRTVPPYAPLVQWTLICRYLGLTIFLAILAVETIRDTLRRLSLALEAGDIGVWDFSPPAHVFFGNARAWAMHGLAAPDQGTLPQADWLAGIHPDDAPGVLRAFEALSGREGREHAEYRILLPGGGVRYLEVAATSVKDRTGRPNKVVGMVMDITERREAEARRMAVEHQLRQAQKMEALGTLAGGIAHDFNNILTAIGGNAELGEIHLPPDHPTRKSLAAILRAHERARELVKRILLFSRKQEARQDAVDLAPVIEDTRNLVVASLTAGVEMRVTVAAGLPRVRGDATQLHQVLMNLCVNAGHALRAHGGRLTVEAQVVEISGGAGDPPELPAGRYVRLTVADTGTGMSPQVRERLFEPFFTTKGQDGTGLGLSVVHGIVRDHQGAITVESELGVGTVFAVYLPAVDASVAPPVPAAARADGGHGRHLLYVDDDEVIAQLMKHMAERLGYRCTVQTDPRLALEAVRGDPAGFDALVTDMNMPGLGGLELAEAVRAIRRDLPVAIASGNAGDDPEALRRAGVVLTIRKPFSMADLGRALPGLFADRT